MASNDAERRQSNRAHLKVPVDYSAVDVFFSEFASNINEGGMFIETDSPADLDEVVYLNFRLPALEEPLEVVARVAWISDGKDSPAGMGVEFQDLPAEIRAKLDDVVRQLRSEQS